MNISINKTFIGLFLILQSVFALYINANTNAFLHQLGTNGLIAYFVIVALVTILMMFLDIWYKYRNMFEPFAISALSGLLLLEQAFTIVMISSGIGMCIVLSLLLSDGRGLLNNHKLN